MVLSINIIKDIKNDLDAVRAPQIENYNVPAFGEGEFGTLHGGRSDTNGYKFFTIHLLGSPKLKVVKGCTVTFDGPNGSFTMKSDTKDIETYYANSLKKGITAFDLFLDKEHLNALKQPIDSITLDFGKSGLFKKHMYSFTVDTKKFKKVLLAV
jgi:hypothetical protein